METKEERLLKRIDEKWFNGEVSYNWFDEMNKAMMKIISDKEKEECPTNITQSKK